MMRPSSHSCLCSDLAGLTVPPPADFDISGQHGDLHAMHTHLDSPAPCCFRHPVAWTLRLPATCGFT